MVRDHVRSSLEALRRLVRGLRLSASDVESRLGISMAQLFVLQRLADGVPRSLVELAAETLTDPSSVSVVVSRLAARKLVARRPDPTDARRAQVTIAARGRALLERAPEPAQERLVRVLARLPERRVAQLATTLTQLANALGANDADLFFEDTRVARARRRRG
jgi:DNA-binding MarR family transcriptional regulator